MCLTTDNLQLLHMVTISEASIDIVKQQLGIFIEIVRSKVSYNNCLQGDKQFNLFEISYHVSLEQLLTVSPKLDLNA